MSAPLICVSMLLLLLAAFPLVVFAEEPEESARIKELRAEVASDPKDANSNYNLGLALMKSIEASLRKESGLSAGESKVAQEAEESFKSAISLSNQTHGRAFVMLGWLYKFQHKYAQAIPSLKEALTLPPESDDYLKAANVLAECYAGLGKNEEALAVVNAALKVHPADPDLAAKKRIFEAAKLPAVPVDDRSQKAQALGAELAKKMERIMGSADPDAVKQQEMKSAQEDYQKAVMALYK